MDESPRTPDEGPRTSLRPPSRAPWLALVAAALVAAGVAWWRFRPAPPTAEQVQQPTATATEPAETPSGPDLGPADQRALLDAVTPDPLVRKELGQEDVIRRWAIVTDNLAEGVSPRKQLQALAPAAPFSVEERGGRTVIAAASYARYDAFADAVASVSAPAAANAYRQLHGMVERAYRALGYPTGSLDRVTTRALQRIASARMPSGDVEVVNQGGVYTFADAKLEGLQPVEKHLVRMGPRNSAKVQAKARELLDALGFATSAAGSPAR